VTALNPDHVPPHLELLCYRESGRAAPTELRANDVAATWLVFEPATQSSRPQRGGLPICNLVDPDGHRLAIAWPES
jgi:hypothetical protein